jgi:formate hydrogenlyase subunit 3/multisubunit Na+/H+ antiporter MnhD subunit
MLLILPLAGFLTSLAAAWIVPASSKARASGAVQKIIAGIGFAALFVFAFLAKSEIGTGYLGIPLFGLWLNFGLTQLSWYFVAMVAGISLVTVLFSLRGFAMTAAILFIISGFSLKHLECWESCFRLTCSPSS